MSLRSPLRRVTGLGSAKNGAHHWYIQRVTAVALVVLGAWFVAALISLGGVSHANVVGWLASPLSSTLTVLLVVTAAYHALLGLQVVIEDYVSDHGTRMAVLLVVNFALVVAAVIGVLAVLRIAFGAAP
jgi:succinate dehydrogenase / fumarate reductase membrane anchor subunit